MTMPKLAINWFLLPPVLPPPPLEKHDVGCVMMLAFG
ncbi:hypothetical protein SLEP1_g60487 [Rubroshorea leprosula]|uniref:Uncharacterized protein n=1 Tax=Rubroshorea leprosula TaxID=152421 RepID=A0AAV5MVE9_9ROSI|nr:hypothetical protein SLEP1_g60487 [Rubroshorea leprosula]